MFLPVDLRDAFGQGELMDPRDERPESFRLKSMVLQFAVCTPSFALNCTAAKRWTAIFYIVNTLCKILYSGLVIGIIFAYGYT